MKKILLLLLTVAVMSCSKEDAPVVYKDKIEIVNHSWEKADHHFFMGKDRWNMRIIATVKNTGITEKTGIIRFVIKQANGEAYLNSTKFTVSGNSIINIKDVDNILLTQEEINKGYNLVEFITTHN